MRDLGAVAEQLHGMHEPQLLTPFAEGHAAFLLKQTFHGAAAGAAARADLSEGLRGGGILKKGAADAHGARIRKSGEAQRHALKGNELIEDEIDEMALSEVALVQGAAGTSVEDELAQQRRDAEDAALARHGSG